MNSQNQVILALGSNKGNRLGNIQAAIERIHSQVGTIVKVSKLYETPAWGFESDPFYNCALVMHSALKAQEILAAFRATGLPLMLDEPVAKLTRIYEELGHSFPTHSRWNPEAAAGHVVLAPPGVSVGRLRQQLAAARIAVLTGWAVDPGCSFQYQSDVAFPLSDHADFPDLCGSPPHANNLPAPPFKKRDALLTLYS